ncbi:MAG: protease, partial [Ferrovibrionaceae bacterium]
MIRLALLLLGHQPMRRQWRLMAGFGLIWIALGLAIVTDAADGITVVATETFGWLLVLEGVIALSFRIGASAQGARLATV